MPCLPRYWRRASGRTCRSRSGCRQPYRFDTIARAPPESTRAPPLLKHADHAASTVSPRVVILPAPTFRRHHYSIPVFHNIEDLSPLRYSPPIERHGRQTLLYIRRSSISYATATLSQHFICLSRLTEYITREATVFSSPRFARSAVTRHVNAFSAQPPRRCSPVSFSCSPIFFHLFTTNIIRFRPPRPKRMVG